MAALSRKEVKTFFDNFQKSAEGVSPENMWNYDKSNLRDDPESKQCLFKGTKYCQIVQNTSKQATSIMMCGSGRRNVAAHGHLQGEEWSKLFDIA
jgi:hypothetical protein